MTINIVTLFPELCGYVMGESIVGRAQKAGKIEINCINIRDFSDDRFGRIDDNPFGGGHGMLLRAEPLARCCEDIISKCTSKPRVIYMSPKGGVFNQAKAVELSKLDNIVLICGHYEGVDERFIDAFVDEEISVGDFVLTGGEIAALLVADSVSRLCEGVLSDTECYTQDSHYNGLLEHPHYTRPSEWRGLAVPEVLLSGHHANIEKWRREQSLTITKNRRPDMLEKADLTEKEIKMLNRTDD